MRITSVGWLLFLSMSCFGAAPNVAFYYGYNPPWEELQAFDVVVVEPDHALDGARASTPRMQVFAYLSVGEVHSDRPYAKDLPQGLVGGANEPWRSHVVDQTHPEWPRFFVERIVAPLWQAGYRGFFLDTMDSFQLISKDDETRTRQAQGLAATIRALRAKYPQAKLIFNRGFEVLPELYREAYAVAAESVYRGWDQKNKAYREVPEADRAWLLTQLLRVRDEYQLPVIAIEYAPPGQRELARDTARKIALLGFVPWVANAELDQLGVGNVEVTPRRVLVLHDASSRDAAFYQKRTHVLAKATLVDLGYAVDYADVNRLPAYPLVGRYVGIVSWFSDDQAILKPGVREWLTRQRDHGMRMVVLGNFPFPLTDALAVSFGLSAGPVRAPRTVRIEVRDPVIGQEAQALAERALFTPLRAYKASTTLLRLRSDSGETMDAAALMPWGGYVLTPYESEPVGGPAGDRWLIQSAEFMRRALAPAGATVNGSSDVLKIRQAYIDDADSPTARAIPGEVTELKKNASERHSTPCCAS